jgi:hypothetical protein
MQWHSAALIAAFALLLRAIQSSLALKLDLNVANIITFPKPDAAFGNLFKNLLESRNYQAILMLLKWSSFDTQVHYETNWSNLSAAHLEDILLFSQTCSTTDALDFLLPPECLASIPVPVLNGMSPNHKVIPAHFSKIISTPRFNASKYNKEIVTWILRTSLQSGYVSADYGNFFSKGHPLLTVIVSSLGRHEIKALFWHITQEMLFSTNHSTVSTLLNIINDTDFGLISREACYKWDLATKQHLNVILCRVVSLLALKLQFDKLKSSHNGTRTEIRWALEGFIRVYNVLNKWHGPCSKAGFTRYLSSFDKSTLMPQFQLPF